MRNKSIDVIKGMAILFVVFYHILWVAVGFKQSPTNLFFDTCCMQVFFFISGYLTFKVISKEDQKCYIKKSIIKKTKSLLIPTIMMFLFSIWYFQLDLVYWCKNNFHNGYWFTYVLFIVFLLHYLIVYPLQAKGSSTWRDVVILAITFVLMVCSGKIERIIDNDLTQVISLSFVLKYWFYFSLGFFASKYKDVISRVISKSYIRVIVFSIAVIPLHLFSEGLQRYLLECFISPARVVVVFYLVSGIDFFREDHFISNQLAMMGRHSLEIYFLHFYFIFGMPKVMRILTEQLEMYVLRGPGATFTLELMMIVPVAVFIAYLCVLTRSVINFAPPISIFFFGPVPKD